MRGVDRANSADRIGAMRRMFCLLPLVLGACYPTPRVDSWKAESADGVREPSSVMPRSWEERVGVYTYADALHELGEPAAIDASAAGIVAVWEKVPRGRACLAACAAGGQGFQDGYDRNRRGVVVIDRDRPAPVAAKKDSLTLVFNDERVLVAWSRR